MKIFASVIFLDRPIEDLDWVLYILIFSMALVVLGRILFNNTFETLNRFDRFQEINDNQGLFGILFQFIFAILLSSLLMGYFMSDYDYIFHTPFLKVMAVSLLILLFFSLRTILGRVGAFALGISYDASYNLKTLNFYRAYSTALLWITTLLYYFSSLNKTVLLIVLALFLILIRIQTYFSLFKNQPEKYSKIWYYIILYLCALEILPVLVLLKFLNIW